MIPLHVAATALHMTVRTNQNFTLSLASVTELFAVRWISQPFGCAINIRLAFAFCAFGFSVFSFSFFRCQPLHHRFHVKVIAFCMVLVTDRKTDCGRLAVHGLLVEAVQKRLLQLTRLGRRFRASQRFKLKTFFAIFIPRILQMFAVMATTTQKGFVLFKPAAQIIGAANIPNVCRHMHYSVNTDHLRLSQLREPNQKPTIPPNIDISSVLKMMSLKRTKSSRLVISFSLYQTYQASQPLISTNSNTKM